MIKYKEWSLREDNKSYPEIKVKIDKNIQGGISVHMYEGWDSPDSLKDISTSKKAEEITKLVLAAPDLLNALKQIQLHEAKSNDEWVSEVLEFIGEILDKNEINNL